MIFTFQDLPSLVSFTFNTWTSELLDAYIIITAYYIYSPPKDPMKWSLEANIIGLASIVGGHTRYNTAYIVTPIVDCYSLWRKVCLS